MIVKYNRFPVVGAKVLAEQTGTNRATTCERGQKPFEEIAPMNSHLDCKYMILYLCHLRSCVY